MVSGQPKTLIDNDKSFDHGVPRQSPFHISGFFTAPELSQLWLQGQTAARICTVASWRHDIYLGIQTVLLAFMGMGSLRSLHVVFLGFTYVLHVAGSNSPKYPLGVCHRAIREPITTTWHQRSPAAVPRLTGLVRPPPFSGCNMGSDYDYVPGQTSTTSGRCCASREAVSPGLDTGILFGYPLSWSLYINSAACSPSFGHSPQGLPGEGLRVLPACA